MPASNPATSIAATGIVGCALGSSCDQVRHCGLWPLRSADIPQLNCGRQPAVSPETTAAQGAAGPIARYELADQSTVQSAPISTLTCAVALRASALRS
jgi:hypothetical protein